MAMVELYYMTIDPGGEELGPAILALLPEEKRERLGRTIRRDDRNRLAWGGILLGHLVALRTGQPFPAVAFGRSETGKPFLREPAGVHFNLAHSGRLIVAALSASPVGVDVEEIGPVDSPAATAGTFMSEKELRLFMRGSGEERLAFFLPGLDRQGELHQMHRGGIFCGSSETLRDIRQRRDLHPPGQFRRRELVLPRILNRFRLFRVCLLGGHSGFCRRPGDPAGGYPPPPPGSLLTARPGLH